MRGGQRHSKLSYLKGRHQANFDQRIFVMARWEAGLQDRWPETFKGEMENNSRNQGT